ncbi:hypothetical protein GCM10010260_09500 [Streptomyces filipinensis]|uniref:Uncharacterized protein n=1 Tax=Streptomyces filipinensis TaxID=66887 RepID=A0A918I7W1_9ACTN|nr:hypothetical protein GCM10010260_09500 [Streptomyces filipinensis]
MLLDLGLGDAEAAADVHADSPPDGITVSTAIPLSGEANLTLSIPPDPQKEEGRGSCVIRAPSDAHWSRYISATRNARSSDWLRFSRGSQAVS